MDMKIFGHTIKVWSENNVYLRHRVSVSEIAPFQDKLT